MGMVQNGSLKSGVFRKWFDELSRSIEWFFHINFSDWIFISFTANLLCIFPAGTRCNNVRFWLYFDRDVVTTTKNQRCNNIVFSMSVFRPCINVTETSWFWCRFPDKNLNVFQYHYNFLFPKICNIALQFHFLINKIYSVCVNAKRSLKWWIFENLQLVAWTEKKDFWSCVVLWSETAPCCLVVNSVGSWFNCFLRSGNQNTGV